MTGCEKTWHLVLSFKPCYPCWCVCHQQGFVVSVCLGITSAWKAHLLPFSRSSHAFPGHSPLHFLCGFNLRICGAMLEGGFPRVRPSHTFSFWSDTQESASHFPYIFLPLHVGCELSGCEKMSYVSFHITWNSLMAKYRFAANAAAMLLLITAPPHWPSG